MKRFLCNLCLFSLLAIAFISAILLFDGFFIPRQLGGNIVKYDNDFDYSSTRLQEAQNAHNIDLLILGSSHAYRGYDVRKFQELGLKTLNLGTSSQTLVQTEFLLKKYIDNLQPKYVILDVYSEIMNSDGVESTTKLLSVMNNDPRLIDIALETGDIRAYETLWFNYVKNSILSFTYPEDVPSSQGIYVKGGYIENSKRGKLPSSFTKRELAASDLQLDALRRIIALLQSRDITYIILQAPIQRERYLSYSNSLDSVFEQYGSYYNFNDIQFLPKDHFIDSHHVNQKGAEVYSKWVLEKLMIEVPQLKNDKH